MHMYARLVVLCLLVVAVAHARRETCQTSTGTCCGTGRNDEDIHIEELYDPLTEEVVYEEETDDPEPPPPFIETFVSGVKGAFKKATAGFKHKRTKNQPETIFGKTWRKMSSKAFQIAEKYKVHKLALPVNSQYSSAVYITLAICAGLWILVNLCKWIPYVSVAKLPVAMCCMFFAVLSAIASFGFGKDSTIARGLGSAHQYLFINSIQKRLSLPGLEKLNTASDDEESVSESESDSEEDTAADEASGF